MTRHLASLVSWYDLKKKKKKIVGMTFFTVFITPSHLSLSSFSGNESLSLLKQPKCKALIDLFTSNLSSCKRVCSWYSLMYSIFIWIEDKIKCTTFICAFSHLYVHTFTDIFRCIFVWGQIGLKYLPSQ